MYNLSDLSSLFSNSLNHNLIKMQRDSSSQMNTESAVRSLIETILSTDIHTVESFIPLAMTLLTSSQQSPIIIPPWRQRKMISHYNTTNRIGGGSSNTSTVQEFSDYDIWSCKLERYFFQMKQQTQQQRISSTQKQNQQQQVHQTFDPTRDNTNQERIDKIHKLYQQLVLSFQSTFHETQRDTIKKGSTSGMADGMMNVLIYFIDSTIHSKRIHRNNNGGTVLNGSNNNASWWIQQRIHSMNQKMKNTSGQPPQLLLHPTSSMRHDMSYKYEEVQLLRECILALQHIDGDNVCFYYPENNNNSTVGREESQDGDEITTTTTTGHTDTWTTQNVMIQYAGLRIRSNIIPLHPLQALSSTTSNAITGGKNDWLLGSGSIDALRLCGEAGWLYHKIQVFIDSTTTNPPMIQEIAATTRGGSSSSSHPHGAVARALASALQIELETYQKFLSTLEYKLHNLIETDLTSRRLWVQVRQPIITLRSLALVVDGISTTVMGGGEILTAIYFHSLHGDTRHSTLMNKIMSLASIPWYDMLYNWIFHGLLPYRKKRIGTTWDRYDSNKHEDGHPIHGAMCVQDFFIEEDFSVDDIHMWHGRYKLKQDQVPNIPCMTSRINLGTGSGYDVSSLLGKSGVGPIIVDMDLAHEALIVGKGINFIRKCLLDSNWSMNMNDLIIGKTDGKGKAIQASALDREELKSYLGLRYHHEECKSNSSACNDAIEKNSLRRTFYLAASQVHKYILESLLHQHHLIDHLRGLKDFLLLGQGDFISALIDTLYSDLESLGNPKDGLYYHHIQGIVQDALRSTNAAFLPRYILEKIGVKLSGEKTDRTKFWLSEKKYPSSIMDEDEVDDPLELLTLDYNVNSPLAAVVYPTVMRKYHRIFSLLFRLKRIDWMLNRSWKQSRALFHALQAMYIKYASEIDGFSEHTDLEAVTRSKILMRKVSMTRQSMLHFLSNLQSYLMFEVLEVGWKDLLQDLSHSKTLDEIIKAHEQYLNTILKKSLLGDDSSLGGNYPSKMERQLRIVLTISYRFCKLHDWIFGEANQALEAAAERRRRGENRMNAGEWGYEESDDVDEDNSNMFTLADEVKLEKVSCIASDFESAIKDLLELLNDKINDGPPIADNSNFFSPGVDSFTIVSSSSLSDTGSKRSRRGHGPVVETDALQFLAYRLDFSDYYERRQ